MTHLHAHLGRWLMVSIPLLMTVSCSCLKIQNPKVYFSTGTTVGLEATPPTTETPPHVTFGYKRAELALIPVTKLDTQPKPKEPDGKNEQPSPLSERGCTNTPVSMQDKNDGNLNPTKDAFSVLASFHLAVNWFGPAKIEQHFATGCAAAKIIDGLRAEEEDKRLTEEAQTEADESKNLLQTTGEAARKLVQQTASLEGATRKTIQKVEEAESKFDTTSAKKQNTAEEADALRRLLAAATEIHIKAKGFQLDADNMNRLKAAKSKAHSAIEKADKISRNKELRPNAKTIKDTANMQIKQIESREQMMEEIFRDTRDRLERVQELAVGIIATVKSKLTL